MSCISGRARLEADAGERGKNLAQSTLAVLAPDVANSLTVLELWFAGKRRSV